MRPILLIISVLAALTAQAASGEYYVYEDFTTDSGSLYQGVVGEATFAYYPEGGYYEIDNLKGANGVLAALTEPFSAYEFSANVEFFQSNISANAYAGLIYNYQEDAEGKASFYLFAVFPDGYYCVWAVSREGQREYVRALTATSLVNPAGRNTLKVLATASSFEIYLNGMQLERFTDYKLGQGGVGLFTSGGTRTRFRAFRWKVEEAEYERRMAQGGVFAFVKEHRLPFAFTDSFAEQSWLEGVSGRATFKYVNNQYVIDNMRGNTMAISYRAEPVVEAGMVSAVVASAEGEAGNGYGVAFCFNLQDGQPSYYAFIIARDGTYKIFRNEGRTAQQLCDWTEFPFPVDFGRPQLLGAAYVPSYFGLRIFLGLNGRMLDEIIDPSPLAPGGFALVAAPQVSLQVSSVNLISFESREQEALTALTASLKLKEE